MVSAERKQQDNRDRDPDQPKQYRAHLGVRAAVQGAVKWLDYGGCSATVTYADVKSGSNTTSTHPRE